MHIRSAHSWWLRGLALLTRPSATSSKVSVCSRGLSTVTDKRHALGGGLAQYVRCCTSSKCAHADARDHGARTRDDFFRRSLAGVLCMAGGILHVLCSVYF